LPCDVLGETHGRLPDIGLIDDVVSVENRASLVPGYAHSDPLGNPTPNEIPGNRTTQILEELCGNLATLGSTSNWFDPEESGLDARSGPSLSPVSDRSPIPVEHQWRANQTAAPAPFDEGCEGSFKRQRPALRILRLRTS